MEKVAILVDGGYYRKISAKVYGKVTAKERADELYSYCNRHLKETHFKEEIYNKLYRIFYYDCPPIDKIVYHPLLKKECKFFQYWYEKVDRRLFQRNEQKKKGSIEVRELSEYSVEYNLKYSITKKLLNGSIDLNDLKRKRFFLSLQQKGVDMKIGLDIASLSFKHQVDKIILIAGDSDFVPAAKLARTEGIDFVLDSLGADIRNNLSLHIDGRRTCDEKFKFYLNQLFK